MASISPSTVSLNWQAGITPAQDRTAAERQRDDERAAHKGSGREVNPHDLNDLEGAGSTDADMQPWTPERETPTQPAQMTHQSSTAGQRVRLKI
jgi:hypothetical protein